MKKASTGGIDATNPSKNLNFWIVNTMPSPQGEIWVMLHSRNLPVYGMMVLY